MKAAFTIATANYLAQAKSLSDSFKNYNPDFVFFIILLDKVNNRFDISFLSNATLIEIEQIPIEPFERMLNRYSIFELSNALKPFVAEYLFQRKESFEKIIYLDSDILIYNSFKEAVYLLDQSNILLTSHIISPLPLDGKLLDERAFLNSGIFNGGFFAVRRSQESILFLNWWKNRLEKFCLVDFHNGMFVDQIWLNFVPIFFKKVMVIENPGYNCAFWNFHERRITNTDPLTVNNEAQLVFFHFSGYDFDQPDQISKYQTRYSFEDRTDICDLFRQYQQVVEQNNFAEMRHLKCFYDNQKDIHEDKDETNSVLGLRENKLIQFFSIILKKIRTKFKSYFYSAQ